MPAGFESSSDHPISNIENRVSFGGVQIGTRRLSDGRIEVSDCYRALDILSKHSGHGIDDPGFVEWLDNNDSLKSLRDDFVFPKHPSAAAGGGDGIDNVVYFLGNSLGLMPRRAKEIVNRELDKWGSIAIEGHFQGDLPWMPMDRYLLEAMADIVGAKSVDEVALMNSLTVNLHLLLLRFYKPTKMRFKLLCEGGCFPSDHYAFMSQLQLHGYRVEDALIELYPREGEHTLRTEDIIKAINENKDCLCVVCLSGVQYYSGQYFDIEKITAVTQEAGAYSLWDLAHAAGNLDLALHKWGVDGAVWCTYKYLNSGAGGIGGLFLHERHHASNGGPESQPYLKGWWGHAESTRFDMTNKWEPEPGAAAMRLSNVPMLSAASMMGSLETFKKTSMAELRTKSILMTGLLENKLRAMLAASPEGQAPFEIITPADPGQRGAQLSLHFKTVPETASESNLTDFTLRVHRQLEEEGIVTDYRNPNLIRVAPAPLYCRFDDVGRFCDKIEECLSKK